MARRRFAPQHRPGKWSGVSANVEVRGDSHGSGGVSLSSSPNFPEPVSRSSQGLPQAQGRAAEWIGCGFPRGSDPGRGCSWWMEQKDWRGVGMAGPRGAFSGGLEAAQRGRRGRFHTQMLRWREVWPVGSEKLAGGGIHETWSGNPPPPHLLP